MTDFILGVLVAAGVGFMAALLVVIVMDYFYAIYKRWQQ